ncbi:MAG: bifunctional 5,10-methylenetetrahydrofolate dehydrogenase/5,10-methenyltetrahydrofolate cyclohydrolase [Patescibacteria group bacterium]
MVKIINGQAIAERVKDEVAQEIFEWKGPRPSLAIVLVGEREDSKLYVSLKQKEAVKVGVDTHLYELEEKTSEEEVLSVIDFLNKDESIDGILVQLPLPAHIDADKIIAAMYPNKDVDGFHPEHPDYITSPVLAAIIACLDEIKFDYRGKTACVFYNSEIFGLSVKEILESRDVEILPLEKSDEADILISALGLPLSVKKEVIKNGAVLIDIGTTKVDGKVIGDIDFEDVKDKAEYITPVPGGIGPMTIAFLFKNVLEIFKRRY